MNLFEYLIGGKKSASKMALDKLTVGGFVNQYCFDKFGDRFIKSKQTSRSDDNHWRVTEITNGKYTFKSSPNREEVVWENTYCDGDNLFVYDARNKRVVIWSPLLYEDRKALKLVESFINEMKKEHPTLFES